ncbi:hypothetical protein [Nostoc sp. FACHB-190]|uniref:hypothetical protein n=1 Tax=Nostoc sp. FACHB-190 TaxID=2692838 RepID=UPI0016846AC2|nr:hypothetical protein [Nostoc sp. FACHB-190]MBD2302274.1 hypothetical protein [Nostoc sp. FACHB-190]
MGYLTVISETGFPHSACLFEYWGERHWRGFKPKAHKTPFWAGYVDTSDRSSFIKNSVKFEIIDEILERVRQDIETKYNKQFYQAALGPDCINLSVDAASLCGLKTPPPPNVSPDNLVINLARLNSNLVIKDY